MRACNYKPPSGETITGHRNGGGEFALSVLRNASQTTANAVWITRQRLAIRNKAEVQISIFVAGNRSRDLDRAPKGRGILVVVIQAIKCEACRWLRVRCSIRETAQQDSAASSGDRHRLIVWRQSNSADWCSVAIVRW